MSSYYRGKKSHRGAGGFSGKRQFGRPNNKYFQRNNKPVVPTFRSFNNTEVLRETEIGITEYVSDHEGFTGILKARYSDFHVNELDMDGNTVKLTDMSVPTDPKVSVDEDDEELVGRYCYEHLPIEVWDKIHAMVQEEGESKESVDIDVSNKTKEERTKIHESVKSVFGAKVVGSTIVRDGIKYISLTKYDKNVKVDRRERWPKERGGDYVHFVVYKEHYDTLEAAMRIADVLRVKPSMISYAGTKDRRGVTSQWFCAKRIEPAVLVEKCRRLNNIHIGNFCYKKNVLKLGYLKGNRFRLALRNVVAEDEVIEKAVTFVKTHGFINYYGLQRFGNSSEVPTFEIGKHLLKGNWKDAVDLILKPRKYESDRSLGYVKQVYRNTGDPKKALSFLGPNRDRSVEGKLLQGLQKHHENDIVNALEYVPRNMRLLYIHAYQSYTWNRVLSRRMKEFGLVPIVGDLVLLDENELTESQVEENDVEIETEKTEDDKSAVDNRKDTKVNIKTLTEEDLKNYTIYDIVLPLPGYGIQYPKNITRDWFQELLEADGLSLEMTKIKVRTYCVSGSYRKCVIRPTNFTSSIMKYNDPLKPLIYSDWDELRKNPAPTSIEDGQYKALILDFCLPSAAYATMLLREILKTDTSSATHAQMNDYHTSGGEKRKTSEVDDNDEKRMKVEEVQMDIKTEETEVENITTEEIKVVEIENKSEASTTSEVNK